MPKDARSLEKFRRVLGPALRSMIVDSLAEKNEVKILEDQDRKLAKMPGLERKGAIVTRVGAKEAVTIEIVRKKKSGLDNPVIIWVHPDGPASLWHDGKLVPAAQKIVDRGDSILAVETYRTGPGSKPLTVNKAF